MCRLIMSVKVSDCKCVKRVCHSRDGSSWLHSEACVRVVIFWCVCDFFENQKQLWHQLTNCGCGLLLLNHWFLWWSEQLINVMRVIARVRACMCVCLFVCLSVSVFAGSCLSVCLSCRVCVLCMNTYRDFSSRCFFRYFKCLPSEGDCVVLVSVWNILTETGCSCVFYI